MNSYRNAVHQNKVYTVPHSQQYLTPITNRISKHFEFSKQPKRDVSCYNLYECMKLQHISSCVRDYTASYVSDLGAF